MQQASTQSATSTSPAPEGILQPVNLRCDGQQAPLAAGARPRLSWRNNARSGGTEAIQSAYEVACASSPEKLAEQTFDVWHSGKVDSPLPANVQLPEALPSRKDVWWKVRSWDGASRPGPWSETAHFRTGLLSPDDWQAAWIAHPENQKIYEAPQCGPWVKLETDESGQGFLRLRFELQGYYPRSFVHLFVKPPGAIGTSVNGTPIPELPDPAPAGPAGFVMLPLWGGLKTGENEVVLKVRRAPGAAEEIAGVACLYEPDGTYRPTADSGTWEASTDGQNWKPAQTIRNYDANRDPALPFDAPRRSTRLMKDFSLDKPVKSAIAYVTGLGCHDLHVNGKPVSDEVLPPGWTDYRRRIHYTACDVTDLLRQGQNRMASSLGNGWYTSGMGWHNDSRFAAADEPLRLLVQLEVTFEDGSTQRVVTDESWQAGFSNVVEDTLYHGEKADGRLPGTAEVSQPGTDAGDVKQARVVGRVTPQPIIEPRVGPPIRVTQELRAKEITEPAPGVFILDFGQNHSSRPRLNLGALKLPAGTTIQLRHSEVLGDDGQLYLDNYRTARVTDRYTTRGGDGETWEPAFTYRGFRYAEITGLPDGTRPTPDFYISRVLHNDAEPAGEFECSDPTLTQVWKNFIWGLRSNLHSAPTDCPQRDERLGWTGDVQCVGQTSLWGMDLIEFYRKWLADVRDAQQPDGRVPHVAPLCVVGPDSAPAWGDVITVLPWVCYRFSGDVSFLEENYEAMRLWTDYLHRTSKDGLREVGGFGDWVPVVKTPSELIGSAFYHLSTRLTAEAADVLGKAEDAAQLHALAKESAEAYHAFHFDPQLGRHKAKTQAADVLPLAFGITPPQDQQQVANAIAADIDEHNGLTTGFVASVDLLTVLSAYGHHELATKLATMREYPSLGYMVAQEATTIWERWNSDTEEPSMNSFNHYAFGGMLKWVWEDLAGIEPLPQGWGFARFQVAPQTTGEITSTRARYHGRRGDIEVNWSRQAGQLALEVAVPPDSLAELHLPADAAKVQADGQPLQAAGLRRLDAPAGQTVCEVPPGRYRFTAYL